LAGAPRTSGLPGAFPASSACDHAALQRGATTARSGALTQPLSLVSGLVALWITGIPASGKSTITQSLVNKLRSLQIQTVVLESDELRKILTPDATYDTEARDHFYHMMVLIGELIVRSGVNVIFDATANRRAYRDHARSLIKKFVEVYVLCHLDVCVKRDPKGIYRQASAGKTATLPGLQIQYEPPVNADVTIDGQSHPEPAVDTILERLKYLRYI
jgi:adenylylsulfate kinase